MNPAESAAQREAEAIEERRKAVQLAQQARPQIVVTPGVPPMPDVDNRTAIAASKVVAMKPALPSDEVFLTRICGEYEITYREACEWVMAIAERMKISA